ncbi:MAG: glycosyltransferase family 39 protein [Saprospiraceae bacterium]|nr:glycosyltransferase family 39 protein [Saprospiraceae bacterium]
MPQRTKHILILLFLGVVFYLPFLGGVHLFDWDEINFAEVSREMLLYGEFLRVYIDFKPFWEKPPFFFWLQATGMHFLGVGEYAARLPNAINGIITLLLVYAIGSKMYSPRFGFFWALTFFGSILPFLYSKSGIIDPWFNLFIFLGIYLFILFYWKKEGFEGIRLSYNAWLYLIVGGLAIGMGIMTKGPVAFLIAALTLGVYWVMQRFRWYASPLHFFVFTLAALVIMFTWYGLETLKNGSWFIMEFNRYQYRLFSTPDAGHKGFPGYHVAVLLIGVFPASIFAMRSFFRMEKEQLPHQQDFMRWMKILFWVVLVLFSIVQSKIVHYSSMCYLPMTYLAAVVIYQWWEGKLAFSRWMQAGIISIGSLYILATLALPWLGRNTEKLKPLFESDPFALGNLEADVHWSGWESLSGVWLILVIFFALRFFRRTNLRWGIPILFIGTAVFIFWTLISSINNIEKYSQNAAISFFQDRQGEDCYVRPIGYKSYAHLFYTMKAPVTNPNSYDQEWLLTGPIDKPAYFITKEGKTDRMLQYTDVKELGRKNGFVFYRREPVTQ